MNKEPIKYKRGDIYYISLSNMIGNIEDSVRARPAVIVSNNMFNAHSPTLQVVYLTTKDKRPTDSHVEVFCKQKSTVLCETVTTVLKDRVGDYISSCTYNEMKDIDDALMCQLGVRVDSDRVLAHERNIYKDLYEKLIDKPIG